MDTTAAVIIALFALIIVAAFLVFRQRSRVEIKGPLDTGLKLDASNQPAPAVEVKGAKSAGGGLVADDRTGRGAKVEDVEVQDDILVSSAPPSEPPAPKA